MKSKSVTFWTICILQLTLAVSQVHAFVTIDADHPDIQYVGRVNFENAKAPILYWPGNAIIANFQGTSINVKLHDYGNNYFYIIIDDGSPSLINLTPGAATYSVASGLADSVHEIQIFKRTETQEGEVAFKGFELEDGKSLVAPPER
ncbi:MAG: electron transporter RnfD, partial [Phycisphaerae bacterium]|nr:electron transporter RnfD [Phycisphaerae bacterium]